MTNLVDAFRVVREEVLPSAVLLIDDVIDSKWTLTCCTDLLLEAGSGPVYVFALASAATGDD